MTLRTVTGTFYNANGIAAANLAVTFRLSPNYFTTTEHNLTTTVTGTTNASGVLSVNLIVGARYVVSATGQKTFAIIVTAGVGSVTLESLHASGDALAAATDAVQTAIQAALTLYTTLVTHNATVAVLQAAIDLLEADLTAEALTRATTDTSLSNAIAAEQAARQAADTALQTDINTRLNQTTGDARYGRLNQIYGPQLTVGAWYHASILASSTTVQTPTLGMLFCIPLLAIRSATWDRVRFEVTVIGSADAVVALGLYAYDATTGRPGSLLATLGSSSNPAVAVHELTVNQAVTPGWYFMALLITGTTAPQIRAAGTPAAGILGTSGMSPAATIGALVQTGQSSLPATPVIAGPATTVPQLGYRIGALS